MGAWCGGWQVAEEEEKGTGQEEGTVEEDKAEVQEQPHHDNDAEQVTTAGRDSVHRGGGPRPLATGLGVNEVSLDDCTSR